MTNPHCQCDGPGFCPRHQIDKGPREFELCKGLADSADCGRKYWLAWEQGKLGAVAPDDPVLQPDGYCDGRSIGLGDAVSRAIKRVTGVSPCGGCKRRAATLNQLFPAKDLPPVEPVNLVEPVTRNFTMHIWPVKDCGAWQWNCDQVLQRAHLFNGRRLVAIASSGETDPPAAVREYLRDFTDEFLEFQNNSRLREVVSWIPMLERLESLEPNEVTFCCHSKGVKHRLQRDDAGSTIFRWTQAMYDVCLDDWPAVARALSRHAMAGAFKRHGTFRTRGNHGWHYTGTFYWFRNRDVFQRNWRRVDRTFFGTESWPGHLFQADETACLLADHVHDLYDFNYWMSHIQPLLDDWRQRRLHRSQ